MKHFQTFESFLNESTIANSAVWDSVNSVIDLSSGNTFAKTGIRCVNGKLEAYYDGMGRGYTTSLGVTCKNPDDWSSNGPEICDELNKANMWLGGIISRPIDAAAKRDAVKIIKKFV